MDGSIDVESTPGEGTTFRVELPDPGYVDDPSDGEGRRSSSPPEETDGSESPPDRPRPADGGGTPTILVIGDDRDVRDLTGRVVEREGFEVIEAEDGEQGIALAEEYDPGAITLDVKMPAVDGWTVLADLDERPELADIPVIFVTMVSERSRGMALRADEYITKPVDRADLVEALEEHMQSESGRVLVVEDDEPTRDLLSRTLGETDWEVETARNGEEALESFDEAGPSLVVVDLMMPKMDGFEFLARLELGDYRDVPIVVVTAKELTESDREMLEGRVVEVVQQGGYEGDELFDRIRGLVDVALASSGETTA